MEHTNKEAATLRKKKTTNNKAKVKKTIKNILCRPDPIFWPNVEEDEAKILEMALSNYKVDIPEFKKLPWKTLKTIPKDQRPKPPKLKKVEGLIFGLLDSFTSLKNKECSAVIIEGIVSPRTIVQPLIEACISIQVPVLCINGLRKITSQNFGIPTSCLAVKKTFLQELSSKIEDIAKLHRLPQRRDEDIDKAQEVKKPDDKMKIDKEIIQKDITNTTTSFTYLYRTDKKTRVFNPSSEEPKPKKAFIGQDFIEFSDKTEQETIEIDYKSMILKLVTSNQNRTKRK